MDLTGICVSPEIRQEIDNLFSGFFGYKKAPLLYRANLLDPTSPYKMGVGLVSIEGIDGCGKSTICKLLSDYLSSIKVPHVTTKQPGGTPLADKIRDLLLLPGDETIPENMEVLMFCAARIHQIQTVVIPALKKGIAVISDRFSDSFFAYQVARGTDIEKIRMLYQLFHGGVAPMLTFYLDVLPEVGYQRIISRKQSLDRIECAGIEFQSKVRDAYLQLAKDNPSRIVVIDGHLPLEVVFQKVVDYWNSFYGAHLENPSLWGNMDASGQYIRQCLYFVKQFLCSKNRPEETSPSSNISSQATLNKAS